MTSHGKFTAIVGLMAVSLTFVGPTSTAASSVNLYKNPECGCCESYADYLRDNGFSVTVQATEDLQEMSQNAGIADGFEGCHLSHVDGYVVSGHVPVEALRRLLSERPDIKGITLPGMPQGSPGMSGRKDEPFVIYELGAGQPKVYAIH